MSIFERAFLTVIADTMARLKAGDSQDAVRSFMDGRVRTLLASWNAVQALEAQLEDYADTWTPERLAGLEERLAADVAKIKHRRVRAEYRRFFKQQMDELRETASAARRRRNGHK